jgi:hypothetical protein
VKRLIDAVSPDVSRAFESVAQVSIPDVDDENDWSISTWMLIHCYLAFTSSYLLPSPHIPPKTWFLGTKPPTSSNPFSSRSSSSAVKDDPGCLEVKLGGTPWYASDGIEVVQVSSPHAR